jgi:predicted nucleic acid-binding protein
MSLLLDTNVYSALKRGHPDVVDHVRRAREVLLSAVVFGELLYGFRHGSQEKRNLSELDEFLRRSPVRFLPVTRVTADRYSRIALALRRKGASIPTNDIWIAAHAMETGSELLSFDPHFSKVDGLVWLEPEGGREP